MKSGYQQCHTTDITFKQQLTPVLWLCASIMGMTANCILMALLKNIWQNNHSRGSEMSYQDNVDNLKLNTRNKYHQGWLNSLYLLFL